MIRGSSCVSTISSDLWSRSQYGWVTVFQCSTRCYFISSHNEEWWRLQLSRITHSLETEETFSIFFSSLSLISPATQPQILSYSFILIISMKVRKRPNMYYKHMSCTVWKECIITCTIVCPHRALWSPSFTASSTERSVPTHSLNRCGFSFCVAPRYNSSPKRGPVLISAHYIGHLSSLGPPCQHIACTQPTGWAIRKKHSVSGL